MLMSHEHDKILTANQQPIQAGESKNMNSLLNRNSDLTWISTCEIKPGKLLTVLLLNVINIF